MSRLGAAAAMLALISFAGLAAASSNGARRAQRRRLLDEATGWGSVEVVNNCDQPVQFVAAYTYLQGIDDGHPCPNKAGGKDKGLYSCHTDWQTIDANSTAMVGELPDELWWYSAEVQGVKPAVYLSKQTQDAFLGEVGNFNTECTTPQDGACVWWAVPELNEQGTRLVLRCPEVASAAAAAPAPAPELTPIEVVNNCSVPIQLKVAYTMAESDLGVGCAIDEWQGRDNHLCVTDWQELVAGEARQVATAVDPFFSYGARILDDPSYELAQFVAGAYQGINDTTACPESDAYGSGYVCEWWAPSYFTDQIYDASQPITITCDNYSAA